MNDGHTNATLAEWLDDRTVGIYDGPLDGEIPKIDITKDGLLDGTLDW